MRLATIVLLTTLAAAGPVFAQPVDGARPTNVAVLQGLAAECLGVVPDTVRTLRLADPAEAPYLRAALVQRWQDDGRTIFADDAPAAPAGLPRLTYAVESAGVAYERASGGGVRRTVTLGLRYTLEGPDGRLLADDRCRDAYSDVVPRGAVAALETEAYPETSAELPPAGWLRRYVEPALLTAATAVSVYLFFVLRRDAGDAP